MPILFVTNRIGLWKILLVTSNEQFVTRCRYSTNWCNSHKNGLEGSIGAVHSEFVGLSGKHEVLCLIGNSSDLDGQEQQLRW